MKFAPGIYNWQVSRRIVRWYRNLRRIESEAEKDNFSPERRAALLAELDSIQSQVAHVHVPNAYAQSLYHLRGHIDLVRKLIGTSQG
jgi:hypothetical protein